METIRAAIFLVTVAIMFVVNWTSPAWLRPDTDKMSRLGYWLRNLSDAEKGLVNGLLAAFAGIGAQWYIVDLLIPSLTAGFLSATVAIINLVVGVGIGFSAGWHILSREYSMFENPQEGT